MKKVFFIIFFLFLFVINVRTHPGRTDSQGCHTNRKTGGYHCHTPKRKALPAPKTQVVKKQASKRTGTSATITAGKKKEKNHKKDKQTPSKKNSEVNTTQKSDKKNKLSGLAKKNPIKKQILSQQQKEQSK